MMYILKMENILLYSLVAILSFLVGSFPTAYVIVRRHGDKDLRREGSGNIGTLNAFEVTRSRGIGAAVLLIDLAKGALPLAVLRYLQPGGFLAAGDTVAAGIAMLAVIAGHNYSPWIGWKGGRGLAPAAGASLLFSPAFLLLWMLFWLAAFWKTRSVHFGNIAATLLAPFVVLVAPDAFIATSVFRHSSAVPLVTALFLLGLLVMLKHIGPFRDLLVSYRQQ